MKRTGHERHAKKRSEFRFAAALADKRTARNKKRDSVRPKGQKIVHPRGLIAKPIRQ